MMGSRISFIICGLAVVLIGAFYGVYLPTPGEAVASNLGGITISTVATGLRNPRGLNFSPDGSLFVAEAGGNGVASANCGVMGDGQPKCSANTSSLARIDLGSGEVTRVLTGLPSLISPNGTAGGATGAQDISFHGRGNGYITVGLGGNPNSRASYFGDAGASYGRLGRFNSKNRFKLFEDIAGYEAANNPDGVAPDSNPYGLLALPGRVVIADAGGNDLIQVAANGEITTLAVFDPVARPIPPPPFVQAVPTTVALGPDGNLYVGVLTGGPFTIGIASVYRVPPGGGVPEVAYGGFTNIIDIAFGPDGSLYVLEIAKNAIGPNLGDGGRLVRIAPDGARSDILSGQAFFAPGGIAIDRDGALYITVGSVSPTNGAVLKVEL